MVPSFHSPPSPADFGAVVLQLEPDTVTTALSAVVPSRSDLVLPDLISGRGKRGALLSVRASEAEADVDGDGDGDGWAAQG